EYREFTDAIRASGHLVDCNRLTPPASATTLRVRNGQVSTTDGPFAETREVLGGYYLIETRDLARSAYSRCKEGLRRGPRGGRGCGDQDGARPARALRLRSPRFARR